MLNGTTLKIVGGIVTLGITALGFISDAINKKQDEDRTREICNDMMNERFGPIQEVEYTEIEDETEQTA